MLCQPSGIVYCKISSTDVSIDDLTFFEYALEVS